MKKETFALLEKLRDRIQDVRDDLENVRDEEEYLIDVEKHATLSISKEEDVESVQA